MKVFLILAAVAMMSQVSRAGVVGRTKRDAVVESFASNLKLMQAIAEATGPVVTKTIEKLPQTEAYAKYKEELEEFLEDYNEYKTKKGICAEKTSKLIKKFSYIAKEYEKEDAPEEAKKIDELLESFGSEALEGEIEQYLEKMEKISEQHKAEKVDEAVEGLKLLAIMLKVC